MSHVLITDCELPEDSDIVLYNPAAGGFTITLPDVSNTTIIHLKNVSRDQNAITLKPAEGQTIEGGECLLLSGSGLATTVAYTGIGRWFRL